jgi:hypothetical protein
MRWTGDKDGVEELGVGCGETSLRCSIASLGSTSLHINFDTDNIAITDLHKTRSEYDWP